MNDANRLLSLLSFAAPESTLTLSIDAADLQTGLDLYAGIQSTSHVPDVGAPGGVGALLAAAGGGSYRPTGRRRAFHP